ncbi:MAG TPA: hypothetical protein VGC98_08735 [Thermoleophilaceae bacterium]
MSRLSLLWLALCVGAFVILCVVSWDFVADDAYISARYANNLANGYGFVWNPHGALVEGFSNPLLVAAEAVGHLAGIPPITVARGIGVGSGVALLLVIGLYAPIVVGRVASNIALLLVASYPPLAFWAVGGLETLPAALVVTGGVLLLCREPSRRRAVSAGSVLAVLPWLRPEGIVLAVAAAAAAELPRAYVRGARREALVRLALAAGIPLASQAVLELFRRAVYGHLLPNSALFKTGTGGTFDVLSRFGVQAAPVILAAAAGVVLARGRTRVLAVPPLVYAVGAIGALNQVNAFSRFLLPSWPQLALLAGISLAALGAALGRGRVAVTVSAAAALAVAGLLLLDGNVRDTTTSAARYADCGQRARGKASKWLRRHTPPDGAYAVSDVGLIGATSGTRTVIDQLGLNEAYIQHGGPLSFADRAKYVLDRRPDAIVLVSRHAHSFVASYSTDAVVAAEPRFTNYRLAHVARVGWTCHYQLFIYRRGAPRQIRAPGGGRPAPTAAGG